MNQLRILQLEKKFGERKKEENPAFSLKPVHLTIEEGEFFSLLGPSGCGKTTLLKLLAGLEQADNGEVWVGEADITNVPSEARNFAMVFQQPLLFPHMNVEDNIAFGLKMRKVKRAERIERAREMLDRVGLKGYGQRFPDELSGGQQQRAALARALVSDPRILLMDEPFSALDPSLREEMRDLLSRIHKEFGTTVVFVTHDREEAFHLSDRIGVMSDGELLQVAGAKELYEKPASAQVAAFLGLKNILRGSVEAGNFIVENSGLQVAIAGQGESSMTHLVIHPERLQLSTDLTEQPTIEEIFFKGIVKKLRFNHGFYLCIVQTEKIELECSISSRQAEAVSIGEKVKLSVHLKDLHFVSQ